MRWEQTQGVERLSYLSVQPMKVSMYAGGNPREFVAGVFLGLVYARGFDDPTLAMYRGLGGMLIGDARNAAGEGVEAEAEAVH
jgi:hypothetical protein